MAGEHASELVCAEGQFAGRGRADLLALQRGFHRLAVGYQRDRVGERGGQSAEGVEVQLHGAVLGPQLIGQPVDEPFRAGTDQRRRDILSACGTLAGGPVSRGSSLA